MAYGLIALNIVENALGQRSLQGLVTTVDTRYLDTRYLDIGYLDIFVKSRGCRDDECQLYLHVAEFLFRK